MNDYDPNLIHPDLKHLKVLREKFSINSFKPEQWKVIHTLIYAQKDCMIIAGTGFGKSLIYQYPAIFLKKKCIIICPLISLMQDQVINLELKGISACFLGSMQKDKHIKLSDYQIIYLTPEFLSEMGGKQKLKTIKDEICLIAIDECHCITQYGCDFRKTYRELKSIKKLLPKVPMLCATATANQYTIDDICKQMQLGSPLIIRAELNRPNLEFSVSFRSNSFLTDVKTYLSHVKNGCAIIYVLRRAETEQYANVLTRNGFQAQPYHAGLKDEVRNKTLNEFVQKKLKFIVATNAFGMGIDRSDVRMVIHYGTPKNIDTYYQESGRAGRDGKPSKCIIFWEEKDFDFHTWCLNQNLSKEIIKEDYYEHCKSYLDVMRKFLSTKTCRRMAILKYFNESTPEFPITQSCCDNCTREIHKIVPLNKIYKSVDAKGNWNISKDSRILLSVVYEYKGRCKEKYCLKFLRGKLPNYFNRNHPIKFFGSGNRKKLNWWERILSILLRKCYIKKYIVTKRIAIEPPVEQIRFENEIAENLVDIRREEFLRVTKKGRAFLRAKNELLTELVPENYLQFLKKTDTEYSIVNGELKTKTRVVMQNTADSKQQLQVKIKCKSKIPDSSKAFQFNQMLPLPPPTPKPTQHPHEKRNYRVLTLNQAEGSHVLNINQLATSPQRLNNDKQNLNLNQELKHLKGNENEIIDVNLITRKPRRNNENLNEREVGCSHWPSAPSLEQSEIETQLELLGDTLEVKNVKRKEENQLFNVDSKSKKPRYDEEEANEPGCSHWSPVQYRKQSEIETQILDLSQQDDEFDELNQVDDEYFESKKIIWNLTKKSTTQLDDLLDYIESFV